MSLEEIKRFQLFPQIPTIADFQILAEESLHTLPELFRDQLKGVAVIVEESPTIETLQGLGLTSPFQLMGLYHGIPIPKQHHGMLWSDHPRIFLYYLPIIRYWQQEKPFHSLAQIIHHVLIHEIGHHFGYSDADMDKIDQEIS